VTLFGLWLASVGVAEVVAGPSGRPEGVRRAAAGLLAGVAAAVAGGWASGLSGSRVAVLFVLVGVSEAIWLWLRLPATWSSERALAALGWLSLSVLIVLTASGRLLVPMPDRGLLERWLDDLPVGVLRGASLEEVLAATGAFLFLVAGANAVVRLLLAAAGIATTGPERRLRGGRVLGPMERVLIFGFGLGGQLGAAALIVAAKGLLRFPELAAARAEERGTAPSTIDELTEYFLVGSMASWIVALAFLPLFPLLRD
jgi:hypothetical protein